jgi:hypothetical protein
MGFRESSEAIRREGIPQIHDKKMPQKSLELKQRNGLGRKSVHKKREGFVSALSFFVPTG